MRRIVTLSLLLLLLLLISCTNSSNDYVNEFNLDASKTVTLLGGQPRTLDPATTLGDAAGPIGHIYSGLVSLGSDLRVKPDLAAGWGIDESRTVYTFYLHPNARFHNGRAVTAEDVRFSWERALSPETGSDTAGTYLIDIVGSAELLAGETNSLAGVQVVDERTLKVTITSPRPYFLAKLTYPVAWIVDQEQVGRRNWERQPNGSGPFTLTAWRDDQVIVLDRNSDYYGTQGNVESVVYQLDGGLGLAMYELGQIDLVGVGGDSLDRVRDPNDPLSADLRTIPSLCTSFIGVNNRQPPFDDVRVRQAFNYAIDKQRLVSGLFDNNALPNTGVLPPGMPGFTGHDVYPYDPDRARALLQEANFDTSQPLVFTTAGYNDIGSLPTAAISMWREVLGVEVSAELVDPFQYADQIYAGNVGNFFSYGWCADYVDPENFLDVLFHSQSAQNWGGYANQSVDAQLEVARSTADVTTRMTQYGNVESDILADAPYIFISHSFINVLVNPDIDGFVLSPVGIPQWHRVNLNR